MPHRDEDLSVEPRLSQLIWRVAHRTRRARLAALEPFGLAAHQARAFIAIARWGDQQQELRPSRLADRLRIAPGSVSDVLDALEHKGLIRRVPSPTDRRALIIETTDAGDALIVRLRRGELDKPESELFAELTDDELATLIRLLGKIADE